MKIEVRGIELAYDSLGHGGYPLVLIHGFGLDRTIWLEMASKYLRDQRVIMPDVRGHGESDAPSGVYAMSLLADDVAYLLDRLEIDRAVVAGHSMGGYITLAFAANHPDRLAGMGMIASRSASDSEEKQAGRYQMVEEVRKRGSVALAESLAPRLTSSEPLVREMYDLIARANPEGIIGALKGMAERPDRTDLLSTIHVPALIAAGEDDQIIEVSHARTMAEALPMGVFLPIHDAGHMPMKEAPAVLGEGLSDLIRRVRDAN